MRLGLGLGLGLAPPVIATLGATGERPLPRGATQHCSVQSSIFLPLQSFIFRPRDVQHESDGAVGAVLGVIPWIWVTIRFGYFLIAIVSSGFTNITRTCCCNTAVSRKCVIGGY